MAEKKKPDVPPVPLPPSGVTPVETPPVAPPPATPAATPPAAAPEQATAAPASPAPNPYASAPGATPPAGQDPYAVPPAPANPYAAPGYGPPAPQGLAIASMVTGIAGVLLSFLYIGFLPAVAAVILGHMAQKRQPHAKPFWITGLITGYVGLAISVVVVIIAIAAFLIPLLLLGTLSGL